MRCNCGYRLVHLTGDLSVLTSNLLYYRTWIVVTIATGREVETMNGTAIVVEIVIDKMTGIEIVEETEIEKEIVMTKGTTGDHVLGAETEDTREGVLALGKYPLTKCKIWKSVKGLYIQVKRSQRQKTRLQGREACYFRSRREKREGSRNFCD